MTTTVKLWVVTAMLVLAASVHARDAVEGPATPAAALEALQAGNARFVSAQPMNHDYLADVAATAGGQQPFAAIISCLDSRVPPEIVFDQGIGDVFVGRIAGNYVDTDLLGSLEFATAVVGAKLIVVLGHTDCGAVKGACDNVELGNLTHTLSNLKPAVEAVSGFEGQRSSASRDFVHAVTHANVEHNVEQITERSSVIAGLVAEGKVAVVGGIYDVATGKVAFID